MLVLAYFSVMLLVEFLIWAAMAAMAFWVWKSTKGNASLLTLIGAGIFALMSLLPMLGVIMMDLMFLSLAAAALIAYGYYLTVKPIVDKSIAELKAKSPPPAA